MPGHLLEAVVEAALGESREQALLHPGQQIGNKSIIFLLVEYHMQVLKCCSIDAKIDDQDPGAYNHRHDSLAYTVYS